MSSCVVQEDFLVLLSVASRRKELKDSMKNIIVLVQVLLQVLMLLLVLLLVLLLCHGAMSDVPSSLLS